MDAKNINVPHFSKYLKDKDYYVLSVLFKPGYHKLLIYDPLWKEHTEKIL